MSNMNIKFLRKNKAIWTLIRVFYQLGLKVWQFVTRATDLGIDFRKLECEEVDNGYTSTCTCEENDDEKRLLHEEKLAYELKRKAFGLAGLGWVGAGWPGCCAWGTRLGSHASRLAAGLGLSLVWVRRRLGSATRRSDRFRSGQRKKEKEEERRKKKRKGEEEKRGREKRERKKNEVRVLSGFNPDYIVFGFMRNFVKTRALRKLRLLHSTLKKFCPQNCTY